MVLLASILVLSSVIAAGIYTRASRTQKQQTGEHTYDAAKVTEPLQVISMVKGLEITGVSLVDQGTIAASLAIDVTNNRDEAVMAVDFISIGKEFRGGIAMDGLLEEDNPHAIIPPHSLRTFTWGLGGIIEGTQATLGAAVFSDGKEEGDKLSLHGIKIARSDYRQQQREKKAKNGGPQ